MSRLRALWQILRLVTALMACLAGPLQAQTLELRNAYVSLSVQGQTQQQAISLPYHWDRHHPGQAGAATFEIPFILPALPIEIFGLYVPRLGNAYEIWLNDTLLQRNGDLLQGNGADYAKVPRYIVISPGLLRLNNVFRVQIRADVGRRGGLAALTLGPDAEVYPFYLSDYRWRSTGSFMVAALSLLIGLVALALWFTQVGTLASGRPQRDPLYLLAAVAELGWAASIGNAIIEKPPLTWPWWGVLMLMSTTLWMASMPLFCMEVAGWKQAGAALWMRRWLVLLLPLSAVASLASLVYGQSLAMTVFYAVSGLSTAGFVLFFIWKAAVRSASMVHRVVGATLLLNILVGFRDLYVFRFSQSYGDNTLLRYSGVLFGLTLGYIVITRFRAVSAQVLDLVAHMAARVEQKEQELEQSYRDMDRLTRDQARSEERTRILRDMHDGVGAHISTAIRQLESGRASQSDILLTLRDSLDQLKLSIDAMHLNPGDVTALLANLRYRLEPRFKACGIELQWDVDLIAPLTRFDDWAMRHLQYMVFEALSNVLQHAHATVLRLELRTTPQGGALLRLIDNGCGFELERVRQRGLSSLQDRSDAIGARLLVASEPGQTVVEIGLN